MTPPLRRASSQKSTREALLAGALVAGVFLSLLGTLRAALRLHLFPRGELGILLLVAMVVVLVPLGVGLKLGYRNETPQSLQAYRRLLPGGRSPTEELLGAILGGAAWSTLIMGITSLFERTIPVVAIGDIAALLLGPALAALALLLIHGRSWSVARASAIVVFVELLLAAPPLFLSPRGPLGAKEGLAVLAQEHLDASERFHKNTKLSHRALALALQACEVDQARGCLLASFLLRDKGAAPQANQPVDSPHLLLRRTCDLTTTDLALCARFVGDTFSQAKESACTVEARCAAGYGYECRGSLLACEQAAKDSHFKSACARRDPNGWREIRCAIPR